MSCKNFLLLFLSIQMFSYQICKAQDYFDWSNVQENDKLNCVLKPNKMFSCRSSKGIIECKSNAINFEMKDASKSMGIGKCEQTVEEENLLVKICLMPKSESSASVVNNETLSNSRNFSLYYSNESNIDGVRIIDFKCYNKLVDFIENSTSDSEVSNVLEQALADVETAEAVSNFYGELLGTDTLIKKRFNHAKKHNHVKRHNHHKRNIKKAKNIVAKRSAQFEMGMNAMVKPQ